MTLCEVATLSFKGKAVKVGLRQNSRTITILRKKTSSYIQRAHSCLPI